MAQFDHFIDETQIEETFPLLIIEESDLFDVFDEWDYPSDEDCCPSAEEDPVIW